MPVRATKRGAERTPFPSGAEYDVVICGASFAGLAVARAGVGAGSLRDRREADLGLLRPDRVDRQPRPGGLDQADVRDDDDAHAGRARALAAAVHVLDLRLPRV